MMSDKSASTDEIEGAISVYQSVLYTVEQRLDTFKSSQSSWPFDSGPCTPKSVSTYL